MEKTKKKASRWLILIAAAFVLLIVFFAHKDSVSETSHGMISLAGGVSESTAYVTDSEGVNVRAHILRVQKGADAAFRVTIKGYYSSGSTADTRKAEAESWDKWGFETMKELAKAYDSTADRTGEVIAASNGDFYSGIGLPPSGNLVVEGNVLNASAAEPYFAVMEDGSVSIRDAEEDLSGVVEAIGGNILLVDNGKNCTPKAEDDVRNPRQGIGVCGDGTVVIINVDGREPASAGIKLHDFADIFRRQDCERAINFDGGGSATFLTKRPGDSGLVYRNVAGDGFERKLSSSLLVVADKSKEAAEGKAEASMTDSSTSLRRIFGRYCYLVKGRPASGFYAVNGKSYLFNSLGIGKTEEIEIGDGTYTFDNGELVSCSDKNAGKVIVGYCGADEDEKNLIYAYHYGNKKLNVGLNPLSKEENGKMKKWPGSTILDMPWYAMRSEISSVYVGDGVINIGNRFLYVSAEPVFDGTSTPPGRLTDIRLPSSLKTIGAYSFFNKPKLKNAVIPAKVKKIGSSAFERSGTGYIRFKGKKVPNFGENSLAETGFTEAYVKKPSAWSRRLEKAGFNKTVTKK